MIVSKFGGTSVGSAKNIDKVIQIIAQKSEKTVVVVSAMGGITNLLVQASELALKGDKNYQALLKKIQEKHAQTIEDLLPEKNQIASKEFVMQQLPFQTLLLSEPCL